MGTLGKQDATLDPCLCKGTAELLPNLQSTALFKIWGLFFIVEDAEELHSTPEEHPVLLTNAFGIRQVDTGIRSPCCFPLDFIQLSCRDSYSTAVYLVFHARSS